MVLLGRLGLFHVKITNPNYAPGVTTGYQWSAEVLGDANQGQCGFKNPHREDFHGLTLAMVYPRK